MQRAVVTLRMLDEIDGEDVAGALGITPGHVAVLLHRAKANLLTCMTDETERKQLMSTNHANLLEITDANFEKEVLQSPLPVLIDFTAAWRPPCRAIAPHVEAIAAAQAGTLKVGTCDVDGNNELTAKLDIRAMPTLMVFKDGRVVGQIVGAVPRAKIEALIARAAA